MIFGVALEALRKQSNCWDKITECSANCEECECHVDASDLVEAVRAVLDAFSGLGDLISRQAAIEALLKQTYQDGAYGYTDAKSIVDALDALPSVQAQQMIPTQMSGTSNYSPKFKPGSKFLLEIGEKRIGLDEYSIVGTDLYVWGSLLEKLTPYEPTGDAISRQAAIDVAVETADEWDGGYSSTRAYMITNAINKIVPYVQTEQKWIPCSERMPEEDHWLGGSGKQFSENVLVTIVNHDDEDIWVDTTHTIDGEWILELPRHCEITAWQQLPESYRGDTE